jgi:branched-chain amino acid transport system substrate-binding protein
MFGIAANTQAIIGYNAIETFAFYVNLAGEDLTGQNLLVALESGKEFHDIFGSPAVKFSPTNHLASAETMVQH